MQSSPSGKNRLYLGFFAGNLPTLNDASDEELNATSSLK